MKKRAELIQKILDTYFPDPQVPIHFRDPYTLLVAVLLSAQSTDLRVNQTTPTLFGKASSPQEMVQLTIDEIEEIIRPIGLSKTKAKAIHALSQILIDQHGGQVPQSFEALEALPGVGHKTASVVMSQAFHIPAFPVDTHIHRCATRWGLTSGKNVRQTEEDLKKLFPKSSWNKLHLQIILFARSYCTARQHTPATCPICSQLT